MGPAPVLFDDAAAPTSVQGILEPAGIAEMFAAKRFPRVRSEQRTGFRCRAFGIARGKFAIIFGQPGASGTAFSSMRLRGRRSNSFLGN